MVTILRFSVPQYLANAPSRQSKASPILYQVKATVRNSKVTNPAVSATDALRLLRKMQTQPGVTSCAVFQKGVLVGQSELESAIRQERHFSA